MSSFNDITCEKCHRRIGWFGGIRDMKQCPYCLAPIDLSETEKKLEEIRKQVEAEFEEKLKNRTPEEELACKIGKASFIHGIKRIDVHDRNPYTDSRKHWWLLGWNAGEEEYYEKQDQEPT